MTKQAGQRVPNKGSWRPGVSGNPNGRPRTGLAFAERVRERVNPDMVIDLAMRVAEDEGMPPETRLAALWPLIDRGFIKPPTDLRATVETSTTPARDWSAMPLEERRELLQRLRSVPRLDGETDSTDDDREGGG